MTGILHGLPMDQMVLGEPLSYESDFFDAIITKRQEKSGD